MKNKLYTLQDHINESLEDPKFQKSWKDSEEEYRLAIKLIEARQKKQLSQRELALKVKTSQAAISRIEAMNGNPSFQLLKRIALALDTRLEVNFQS